MSDGDDKVLRWYYENTRLVQVDGVLRREWHPRRADILHSDSETNLLCFLIAAYGVLCLLGLVALIAYGIWRSL